jgi:hypothetical protein
LRAKPGHGKLLTIDLFYVNKLVEMGDGRWEMGDGRWEIGDGRLEIGEIEHS